ncbi:DUF2169 family type VI secretion system accessory protein [Marinomonas aquiplantarum]|uniref:Pentapeptide repeat protein n=1 Tax=Marinomonas aquiplantarum TaxID=491951 RepID=A0A366CVP1_9GAMM|nr:DUF2169 domain-containing protein [Marinomonas aquiplantarum]RBO81912.1 pentapeptide repeat protein [Marinomonas aquiplantarum]
MQIIKPGKLSLISKTYGYNGHQCAVGAMCFFQLGVDDLLLTENGQWPRITPYLSQGILLDMGFAKPHGEWLLAGSAYAVDAVPVRKMQVSASLGNTKKTLQVIGDRHWQGGLFDLASKAKAFTRMPLGYQGAYGAYDYAENPLGKGVIKEKYKNTELDAYLLPNLYVEKDSTKVDKHPRRLAGFGPLEITWPQRACFQGTYDQDWLEHDHPGLPKDTQARLFNAAPEDQQMQGFILPGTHYALQGLHSEHQRIEGTLPNIKVRAFIRQQIDSELAFREVETAIDTVWFFPELLLGVAIYRGVTEVEDSDGLDIKQLMLACEGAQDKPRDMAYYEHVLALRTDPETALGHVFNESQLMPVKTQAQQQAYDEMYAEAKRSQQQKVADIRQKYRAQIQTDNPTVPIPADNPDDSQPEDDEPGPIPQALIDSGDVDLSSYLAYANRAADQARKKADKQLAEARRQADKAAKRQSTPSESVASMKARVNNRVFVTATDLMSQASYQPPEWMSYIPTANALNSEQQQKVREAEQLSAKSAREARQHSPSVMVLSQPLPEHGPQQIRAWVEELIEDSASLAGRDLAGADLSGLHFSGVDLRDVMLEKANLTACHFTDCRLDGAVFTAATLEAANFTKSSLVKVNFAGVQATGSSFQHTNLSQANFTEALFDHCDFKGAVLDDVMAPKVKMLACCLQGIECNKATFVEATLSQGDWQHASLTNCIFLKAQLQESNWQDARLERCMMLDSKAQGADFSRVWAEKVQFSNQGDLQQLQLANSVWRSCGFRGVDMSQSAGREAVFIECDFGETDLTDSHFERALFHFCIMTLARLERSHCKEAMFNSNSLRKCQFIATDLRDCELVNNDMTESLFEDCLTKGMQQGPMPSIH